VSDEVLAMRAGRVVEAGPAERVLTEPEHAYTRALVAAVPRLDRPATPHAVTVSKGEAR
jgi:ABC-type dipeptide/oligopeptide/nickel transport system ATPase component